MQVIPTDSGTELTTILTAYLAANSLVIVSVLFIGVAVAFIMRWFNKSTRRLKA